ncbi:alpha/beta hydrolase [Jannaschia sp. M317]|nr:alpha/beta hydrolase [Jannaschia sp. M317]UWQ17448.1 alpha/beta hydrolase [Jannaschia sp. M317]
MSKADWLFIPGTLCDGRVFAPLIQHLGQTASGSIRVVQALDKDDLSALAHRAVEGLGARIHVVGFSLGCQVAFEIMRQAPDRCAGITLISTTARPDTPDLAPDRRAMVNRFQCDGAAALVEADLWPRYVAEPQRPGHPAKDLIHSMAHETPSSHLAAQIELAIGRPDSRPALSCLDAPVLMINGQEDRLTPVDLGAEIASTARNGMHSVIPAAGHFVLLEEPEATAAVIHTWVRGLNQ